MRAVRQRRVRQGMLLVAALLGMGVCLRGLASTLRLGDAQRQGLLLVPALSPTLAWVMLGIVSAYAILTVFLGLGQRRRRRQPEAEPERRLPLRSSWQVALSLTVWGVALCFGLAWLLRHNPQLQQLITDLHTRLLELQTLLHRSGGMLERQVRSSLAGYALFLAVSGIYGGLALLALWALLEEWRPQRTGRVAIPRRLRHVQQAVAAGLQALHHIADPRQAIVACYGRLEHLLVDYGVPVSQTLTPQESMDVALQGLDLPQEALAGLVELFELARYSLHPLDDTARQRALAYLETLQAALTQEAASG
ncbi:MAG: hypothetical protein KatS3mg131_3046 [Candidatus Tectimicrobiota bacterium]|nr:MAG: hypothetical protein KatS3mg131_3046 [Candidatus Tectomicrobia bacterium]